MRPLQGAASRLAFGLSMHKAMGHQMQTMPGLTLMALCQQDGGRGGEEDVMLDRTLHRRPLGSTAGTRPVVMLTATDVVSRSKVPVLSEHGPEGCHVKASVLVGEQAEVSMFTDRGQGQGVCQERTAQESGADSQGRGRGSIQVTAERAGQPVAGGQRHCRA